LIPAHALLALAALAPLIVPAASEVPPRDGQGASAVVEPDEPSALQRRLDTALDDERHAIAFYRAVMGEFGERRPFSNIIHAERRHANALLAQYERLGLLPPHDRWAEHAFALPDSFADACDAAVVAEVRNGAIYDTLIEETEDETVKTVFERLRWASVERHLPAFRRHGSGWKTVAAGALSGPQAAQRTAAFAARDALFGRLFAELSGAMADGGPVSAIGVCADRAPAIAKAVSAEHGVRIGRTALKRRNPGNTPPAWADLILDDLPTTPVFRADRNGRLGAIAPIVTAAACTQCHGQPDALAPGVADALAERYPGDRATGFREGDLRGWFWIEVPATPD
jgi:rubrerythrin